MIFICLEAKINQLCLTFLRPIFFRTVVAKHQGYFFYHDKNNLRILSQIQFYELKFCHNFLHRGCDFLSQKSAKNVFRLFSQFLWQIFPGRGLVGVSPFIINVWPLFKMLTMTKQKKKDDKTWENSWHFVSGIDVLVEVIEVWIFTWCNWTWNIDPILNGTVG